MNESLTGRFALVTGASRGIGAGVARDLAAAGMDLAVTARETARLEPLREEIVALGRRCLPLALDVTDVAAIDAVVARIEAELGPIELLVNNAGVNIPRLAVETTKAQWDDVLDTNLKGVFSCAQALGRRMTARKRGTIVNVASAAGMIAAEERAHYCASKAGVIMVTKELALEWAPFGMRERWTARIPPGWIATVADVAAAVRYLASSSAGFVTGVTPPVDGGLTMR